MATYQDKIAEIQVRYQTRLDALTQRGNELAAEGKKEADKGAGGQVDFDIVVTWEDKDIYFDLPVVKMNTREMSLDLPKITMRTQEISFDFPEIYMEDVVLSDYPLPRTVISVPKTRTVRHSISTDIPEFTMATSTFTMDIPEVYTESVHWVLRFPEFTAKDFNARVGELQEKGKELKTEAEQLAAEMQNEFKLIFQTDYAQGIQGASSSIINPYTEAVIAYDSAIKSMEENKIDPIKVPTKNGDRNLRKERDALVSQYKELATQLNNDFKLGAA